MTFFYPFRFLSLYGGHWPLPDYQTFHYPGIPSVLVPYDQTNDFYFSGHTGLCTCMLFMFILHYNEDEKNNQFKSKENSDYMDSVVTQSSTHDVISLDTQDGSDQKMTLGHKLAIAYGVFTLILTLYMLTITRGHYFNDLLIGFLVALTGIYYASRWRFTIFYWILWGYARFFDIVICHKNSEDSKKQNLISENDKKTEVENL
jgi:hypothetical protein